MKRLGFALACFASLQFLMGCSPTPSSPSAPPSEAGAEDHGHDHGGHGAGPHGGTLTDWGGGAFHVEFTVDHNKKEATVYIVGSDEKSPSPIKAEKIQLVITDPMTDLDLIAQPLAGEAAGTSSRFVGTHETLGIVKEFEGTISGQIDGTPYTGNFKEEPHGSDYTH